MTVLWQGAAGLRLIPFLCCADTAAGARFVNIHRRQFLAYAAVGAAAGVAQPAGAVIVLDSTWWREGGRPGHETKGFGAHIALANQPQFASLVAMARNRGGDDPGWGAASGTWIGNVGGRGRILTSAHVFNRDGPARYYLYRTASGDVHRGTDIDFHPLYNWSNAERTGYDFAIVTLRDAVTDSGPPPALHAGPVREGMQVVMIGYGSRGIASEGQQLKFYEPSDKAAAENVVSRTMAPVLPVPTGEDAGNWFGVTLRRESEGASRLDGLLGSGDSGGSTWMKSADGWAIAGVNSNGTGDVYGKRSYFAQVSGVRNWLNDKVPGLRFVD